MNTDGGRVIHAAHTYAFIRARRRRGMRRIEHPHDLQSRGVRLSRNSVLQVVGALAMFVLCAATAFGQSTFGSILGTVQDTTGAPIQERSITAHSLDENEERTTTSGSSGEFVFENLKAGHYKVTVHKDGFTDSVVSSATLEARQELRLPVTLTVTAGTTTVEVSADAALMNTENGTLNNTISNVDITQLPINSRSVSSSPLAALAVSPEVTRDSQGNIAVGGATSAQTGFSVDGISTANVRFNGALQDAYPSMESIAEMKVTAFNNNAEFAQIGDVTFTTKSGTNQLHGSAFEYFQNSALDATVLNFPVKAPRTFNTFGGSLGGPVTIPKLYNGRDKTFFFVDYEGNRKTQSYPEELLVPSAADRAGNLNDLVQALGAGPVINPFTGAAFPNNTIPTGSCQACINPVAQALLNYYPLPNANLGVLNPSYNYQTLGAEPLELQRLRCPRRSQFQFQAAGLCALQLQERVLYRVQQRRRRCPGQQFSAQ